MESKRLLLATVLSIAIVLGYQFLMARFAPPPPPTAPRATASPAPTVGSAATPGAAGTPAAATARGATDAAPTAPASRGDIVTVTSDRYVLRFSTAGGALVEARLVDYRSSPEPGAPPVAVADVPEGALVPSLASGAPGQPAVGLPPGTLFRAEPTGGLEIRPGQEGTLSFTAEGPGGLRVTNRYVFGANGYAFLVEQTVVNAGRSATQVQPLWLLRDDRDTAAEQQTGHPDGAIVRRGRDVRRVDFPSVEQPERVNGPVEWAGTQDKYFAAVLLPKGPPVEAVVIANQPAPAVAGGSTSGSESGSARPIGQIEFLYPATTLAPGATTGVTTQVYLGPKDVGTLRAVDPTLESVLHFGFFHWVAMPLLLVLRWLHGILRNYGVAIIALTVLIKAIFWPLTQKQIRSSKAMAKVQPLINQLREKYKDDRDAMNREMMKLFKEHNVNPLMGCLPLLVQIPVFFALYQVLNGSIELRQAPFVGWIQDLSAHDPYYITPVLMGVTMFISQKLTPTPGMEPTQQKIMLFMPAIMSVFFFNMPSGLVLYWLVMNLLQIGQQVWMNRQTA